MGRIISGFVIEKEHDHTRSLIYVTECNIFRYNNLCDKPHSTRCILLTYSHNGTISFLIITA